MTVTFDSLTLKEPDVKPQPKPQVNETELVSGKTKLTVSSTVKKSWQISCITESLAEYSALLAKLTVVGSLVINGATNTKCVIKSWREKEMNPSTKEITMQFVQDTT
ncbi:hypothetical protein ACKUB1_13890 [Methanospirillum stamsii]|uniref:Phage tail protein n=1 Tax=Methanospirillum stamsii TaxID=1277351 RepID=A0A2V2N3T0_9EURY|nr:hypothetical protein [Methanospirillum stamsii]PWR74804.1 hypothetical protein DLD82_07870 [Methanospirillum stamsii]